MKQSSIVVAALLSCLAAASPNDAACGAPQTITITQVISSAAAQGTVYITVGNTDVAAAPSFVTVTKNLGDSIAVASGAANAAASVSISAIPSAAVPPASSSSSSSNSDSSASGSDSSASSSSDSSASSSDSSDSSSGASSSGSTASNSDSAASSSNSAASSSDSSASGSDSSDSSSDSSASSSSSSASSSDSSTSDSDSDSSTDDTTDSPLDITQDDLTNLTVTNVQTSTLKGGASTVTITNIATHFANAGLAPAAKTVTDVLTSMVDGAAHIITVTSTIEKDVLPTPGPVRLTTLTKVYTSVIDGGARTVTVTKTETHTLHQHHMIATGVKTGSGSSPTHHVTVGKDGKMSFEPSYVNASQGDMVRFRFFPSNHTVTSSDFDTPCKKNDEFDSGFKPTFVQNSTLFADFQVNDASKPLWFHSRQKDECKQGMVFAINPKDQDQFNQFSTKATASPSLNQTNSAINSTIKASNGTTLPHPINLTTNTTATNATRKAMPMRLRNRRFAGGV